MQRGRRVEEDISGLTLHRLGGAGLVDDQLAAFIMLGLRQKEGEGHIGSNPVLAAPHEGVVDMGAIFAAIGRLADNQF